VINISPKLEIIVGGITFKEVKGRRKVRVRAQVRACVFVCVRVLMVKQQRIVLATEIIGPLCQQQHRLYSCEAWALSLSE
jgi:hypothetical protein